MNQISPHKTGLALGAFVGGLHLLWSVLVALDWAQPLINFIFIVHMVKPIYTVDSFSFALAGILVVVTAIVGYVVGRLFALVWNRIHQDSAESVENSTSV